VLGRPARLTLASIAACYRRRGIGERVDDQVEGDRLDAHRKAHDPREDEDLADVRRVEPWPRWLETTKWRAG